MTEHEPTAYVAAPAAAVASRRPGGAADGLQPSNLERIDEGIDVLRFCGLVPVELPTARARASTQPFLAGTDAERAADVRAALLDESIAGVLTVCGGYGSQRMLEVMDWSGLDDVAPKVVVGYSDVTALLEALASRLGWSSVMGPMVAEGEFRESYSFSVAVVVPGLARELRTPGVPGGQDPGRRSRRGADRRRQPLAAHRLGRHLHDLDPAGGIVLVEDEQEDPPRTDIMLTHLRRSGYFDRASAVVAGTFTNSGDEAGIQRVLDDRLGDLGVPVVTGANLGHGGHVQTWPIGVRARLDADARTLTFLEPPLS